jgi:hypothetical protein
MSKRAKEMLIISVLIFLMFQVVYLFFSPFAFYHEDQKVATLGIDLLQGKLRLPFWFYLDSPHLGGSIYTAILAVPFYFVFGKNYLALKLSGLFLAGANFLILGRFLIKKYGLKILLPFSLIFSLAPTRILMHYTARPGNTTELFLVISMGLVTGYKLLNEKSKHFWDALLFGFVSGLGLWIQYAYVAVLITIFFLWFLKNKVFFIEKKFFIFAVGLLFGLIPFIIFNYQYNFASFTADQLSDYQIINFNLKVIPQNIIYFFSSILPRSFLLLGNNYSQGVIISFIFYFLVLLSLVFLVLRMNVKEEDFKFLLFVFISFTFLTINTLRVPLNVFPHGKFADISDLSVFSYYYPGFFLPVLLIILVIFVFKLCSNGAKLLKYSGHFVLILLFLILGFNFLNNIRVKEIENISAKSVGYPSKKSITEELGIQPVGNNFYFNSYLFNKHADIYANAYEAGYHFSRNIVLFRRLLKDLDPEYRGAFISGAGNSYNRLLRDNKFDELDSELLLHLVNDFSLSEKKVFFSNALVGEVLWFGSEEELIFDAHEQLEEVFYLDTEGKEVLNYQFTEVIKDI